MRTTWSGKRESGLQPVCSAQPASRDVRASVFTFVTHTLALVAKSDKDNNAINSWSQSRFHYYTRFPMLFRSLALAAGLFSSSVDAFWRL